MSGRDACGAPSALAEVFETTPGAIRVRLHRARKKLERLLAPDADDAELDRLARG